MGEWCHRKKSRWFCGTVKSTKVRNNTLSLLLTRTKQEVKKPEEDGDLRDVEVSGQDERPDEVVATVASNLETWNLGSGEK